MKILIYSFNDKIGDGLQKISFLQQLRIESPEAYITYTTTRITTLKSFLNPLVKDCIDEFIEHNEIKSSLKNIFFSNKYFNDKNYDLIIDLQKVVLRTISLKRISNKIFFSTSANFIFSDIKNFKKLIFKGNYIEEFYFNILKLIINKNIEVRDIKIPHIKLNIPSINNSPKKKIAISPGASSNDRKWKFENYLEIAYFLKNKGFEVFFFLGPDELEYLNICRDKGFECPEWTKDGHKISNEILFIMNLAKKMDYCLSNDSGTSWFFQFAGVKTLKIFGRTSSTKFSRPKVCSSIQTSNYGYNDIREFPLEIYKKELILFLNRS